MLNREQLVALRAAMQADADAAGYLAAGDIYSLKQWVVRSPVVVFGIVSSSIAIEEDDLNKLPHLDGETGSITELTHWPEQEIAIAAQTVGREAAEAQARAVAELRSA